MTTTSLASGTVTATYTSLASGTVTATYSSDAACFTASIDTATVTVNPADTTTLVTALPDPSVCGELVTICAQVTTSAPGSGIPTGTVTFTGPGGLNVTAPLDAAGNVCVTSTSLASGTVTATYNGAACFNPSTDTVDVTVNPASTTTLVSAMPDPSVCGELVTVCATVTTDAPGSGIPTGTVTFTGPGGLNQTVALDATGKACLTTTSLASGTVTATYNGAACFTPSTDTVGRNRESGVHDDAGDGDTGSVRVRRAGDDLRTGDDECAGVGDSDRDGDVHRSRRAERDGAAGCHRECACVTTTSLASGTVTATYNGAACFTTSTDTVGVTVNPASTTTLVTATPDPSVCGELVTICATVTTNAPGSGIPTGTVTFTGPGGLNQTQALDATGKACLTTTSLASGTVTATYNGAACFTPSTDTVGVTVNPASTTTLVTAVPNPSVCGQSVTVCAQVTTNAPGSGIPTGTVTFTGPGGLNVTAPLDATGNVCVTTTSLASGTVTATYNGAACFTTSIGTTTVTVNPASTTTLVTATPDPSVCGELVTICAQVTTNAPGSGIPTGTVTFTGPGGLNVTAPLDATGNVCVTTTSLASGTVTATYNGAACFTTSTDTVGVTVNEASTTTVVTAVPDPSVCGELVTICATVTTDAPGSGIPTGTVTFTGPGGLNVTAPLDATGNVCVTTTSLASGTVTATYNGEGPCFAGSSDTVGVTVNPASTTTLVTAVPDPSVCGELVTICAQVTTDAPGSGIPTGTVTFTGPGGLNVTAPLDATGNVCVTTTSLASGTVTATYNGAACFTTSTDTVGVTVNPASTTTVVTAVPNPSVCGQSVTVCATVTANPPGSGIPTGTVTFTGPGGLNVTAPLDATGKACLSSTSLASGTVTATYNGAACFNPSTDTVGVTVNEASTTTAVTAVPNPSVCGQSVTVCATVTTNAPGSGIPTGTVTFTGPGGLNQTVALDATGKACLTSTSLATGTVTATYNGEGPCFAGSSGTVGVTVNPASTTTAVTAVPNPSVCGQSVTVCAQVTTSAPGSGIPTGTVTFTGPGGLNQTVPLDATGKACFTSTSLVSGTVTAHYNGAACFTPSTGTVSVTVNEASTTTTVTAVPNPSVCGQAVTVCATVTANPPGSGIPTGTVTFTGPGGLNVTAPLDATGKACLSSTSLSSGTVTAHYNGEDPCFTASTGTVVLLITPAATTTTVSVTPNPSACGQSVTVCATVTANPPGSGIPTGTVTFLAPGGIVQTVALDATGKACLTTTSLASGTVIAIYNGSSCDLPSSGTTTATVTPAATTTTVSATPNPSVCGQSVTVCAQVTANAPGSGIPTGTVTFTGPGGLNQTVPLDATGKACLTTTSLSSGTITAHYNGAPCFTASTGTTTVTVGSVGTTTAVTASPNPSVCGQSVTVCATVTVNPPGSGIPTGTVTFTGPGGLNQTVPLDATDKACLTTTSLSSGTVTAHYNGAACFGASTGTTTVTVNPAATTTTVSATPNPSACGQSVTVCAQVTTSAPGSGIPTGTVTFTGPGGLNQTVALDATGKACFTSTSLSSGTITAHYNGATCFGASTGTVVITSTAAATTLTVSPSPAQIRLRLNGSFVIQAMSATLKDSATNTGIPGMTVTFRANTAVGPLVLGTAVTNASGVATLAPPNVTVPATAITATTYTASFAGSGCHSPASATAGLIFIPIPPVP